jgi:hypothetical protein
MFLAQQGVLCAHTGTFGSCKGFTKMPEHFYQHLSSHTHYPDPMYCRTYASAVAGSTVSAQFNDTARKPFRLVYKIDPSIMLPTEIRVSPAENYPHGVDIKVIPSTAARAVYRQKHDPFVINIFAIEGVANGALVTVEVRARCPDTPGGCISTLAADHDITHDLKVMCNVWEKGIVFGSKQDGITNCIVMINSKCPNTPHECNRTIAGLQS